MTRLFALLSILAISNALFCNETETCRQKPNITYMSRVMKLIQESRNRCIDAGECPKHIPSTRGLINEQTCSNGKAGVYSCSNVDLLSFTNFQDLGSSSAADGNDIWGWKDPATNRVYAITGQTDGASVVDVTDPVNPNVIGFLPSKCSRRVVWRDIKTYKNYAYIVADGCSHGMQVIDMNRVIAQAANRANPSIVPTLTEDAYYDQFGNCHNLFINEDTASLYAVGSGTCAGGLHVVDVSNPLQPTYGGCFSADGYTHDVQCVVYNGPDSAYTGKEICFAFNEDTLTIVDTTDKANMKMISRKGYQGVEYCHQGWLTTDQKFLLIDDELDELYNSNQADGKTETYVWDVQDLANPKLIGTYFAKEKSIDHNLYIVGNLAYETNYEDGLRILDLTDVSTGTLKEVGYFDVYPEATTLDFLGSWSSYPFWMNQEGFLIVQSVDRGLFVLRPSPNLLNRTQAADQ